MSGITKEQINQAREADLFAYLECHEHSILKRDGNNYRHKEHDSLVYVPAKDYRYCNSRGKRINALDYLMEIRGYGFVDAVNILAGPSMQISSPSRLSKSHTNAREAKKPDRCYLLWRKQCATLYVSYIQKRVPPLWNGQAPDADLCYRPGNRQHYRRRKGGRKCHLNCMRTLEKK